MNNYFAEKDEEVLKLAKAEMEAKNKLVEINK